MKSVQVDSLGLAILTIELADTMGGMAMRHGGLPKAVVTLRTYAYRQWFNFFILSVASYPYHSTEDYLFLPTKKAFSFTRKEKVFFFLKY